MNTRGPTKVLCRRRQHVFMREAGAGRNDGEWAHSTAYMSTNGVCGNQYHVRLFTSKVHAEIHGPSHENEWVLAPIHHDKAVRRCVVRDRSSTSASRRCPTTRSTCRGIRRG